MARPRPPGVAVIGSVDGIPAVVLIVATRAEANAAAKQLRETLMYDRVDTLGLVSVRGEGEHHADVVD